MMGKGEGDVWWEVRYDVKGPKKDYESVTRYERVTG
jgi:tRNA A64-2'-O-ribosylphosphate transferase